MKFRIEINKKSGSSIFVEGETFEHILNSIAATFNLKPDKLKAYGELNSDGKFEYLIYYRKKLFGKLKPFEDRDYNGD
ncbi:hypothetical protein ISS30_08720 [bacterium]|nr:hypothetical protein [bacterium]